LDAKKPGQQRLVINQSYPGQQRGGIRPVSGSELLNWGSPQSGQEEADKPRSGFRFVLYGLYTKKCSGVNDYFLFNFLQVKQAG